MMSHLLKNLMQMNGYHAPAGDGDGGGGFVDRGDDFPGAGTADADTTTNDEAAGNTADAASPGDDQAPEGKETEAKATETDDPPRDDKGRFIPKDRFDEAVRKERGEKEELARRLKEYQDRDAQTQLSADFTEAQKAVKDMIKQHTSLLADGELDKAANLMEQILELKEAIAERKAELKAASAKNTAKEEMRYEAVLDKIESTYPALNPDAPEFDVDVVKDVQALMSGLMQTQRMSSAEALQKAVSTLLGKPKKDEAPPNAGKAADLGLRRKEDAVKKALDAKSKQPASTKDVGIDHDKEGGALDASAVMKMTWDEFVKLPESKLSELRGDFV